MRPGQQLRGSTHSTGLRGAQALLGPAYNARRRRTPSSSVPWRSTPHEETVWRGREPGPHPLRERASAANPLTMPATVPRMSARLATLSPLAVTSARLFCKQGEREGRQRGALAQDTHTRSVGCPTPCHKILQWERGRGDKGKSEGEGGGAMRVRRHVLPSVAGASPGGQRCGRWARGWRRRPPPPGSWPGWPCTPAAGTPAGGREEHTHTHTPRGSASNRRWLRAVPPYAGKSCHASKRRGAVRQGREGESGWEHPGRPAPRATSVLRACVVRRAVHLVEPSVASR